jgi:phosphonate transport system substrate-binding protein
MSAENKKKLDDFLLSYGQRGDQREADILKALQWKGFKRSSNDQLDPIRQLELFKEKKGIEDKGNPSAKEKQRVAEIDAQLAALAQKAK